MLFNFFETLLCIIYITDSFLGWNTPSTWKIYLQISVYRICQNQRIWEDPGKFLTLSVQINIFFYKKNPPYLNPQTRKQLKLFGLRCYILLYTGVAAGVATWKNTTDPPCILKISQEHLSRDYIQNEKNQSSALFMAELPNLLLGSIHTLPVMYKMSPWGQGQDTRTQNTKKLTLKLFRYYLEVIWLSVTEKMKTNTETSWKEGILPLQKWNLRRNMVLFYKLNEGTSSGQQNDLFKLEHSFGTDIFRFQLKEYSSLDILKTWWTGPWASCSMLALLQVGSQADNVQRFL